jgi:hypothetical protein
MSKKTIVQIFFVVGMVLSAIAIRHVKQSNLEDFTLVKAVITDKGRGGNSYLANYTYSYRGRSYADRDHVPHEIVYSDDLQIGDTILIKVSIAHPEVSEIENLFPD